MKNMQKVSSRNAKRNGKRSSRAGFTLVELIVVITIIGIFAAIAVPSMIGFIEHGKQVNRMNIARTIYLATQNQLTKSSVEKNLKSTMTGFYYQQGENDKYYLDLLDASKTDTRNVAQVLTSNFPSEEAANTDYVHYISKPKDYSPPADDEIKAISGEEQRDEAKELKSFYHLLDEIIIDKTILNDAILIEYNIETGVVLSVFYSDAFNNGQTKFEYLAADNNDRNNVTGGRSVDNGYSKAAARHQGYYGVEATGKVSPPNFKDIVNIYDGAAKALDIGSGEAQVNVLYVEFLLAKQYKANGITEDAMPAYTFEIVNANSSGKVISIAVDNLDGLGFPTSFNSAFNSSDAIYRDMITPVVVEQYGIKVSSYYNRYIWIIDYIDGDILSGQPQSISVKYKDGEGRLIAPQNVRAKASKGGGAGVTSLSLANTHFNSEMSGGKYEIKTARHLNNIRYMPSGKYRQTADIDMQLSDNAVTNFAPIENFSGEYYAMKTSNTQYKIINLKISADGQSNIGLFANVSADASNIQGISLYQATISAVNSDNVGAIAGIMTGGTVKQCSSYANITVSGTADTNVGGLIGSMVQNATLDQSFNAGFYDTHKDTLTAGGGFGSVMAGGGNIGGLVGWNSGTIQSSFNNARVNIDDVVLTDEPELLSSEPVSYPIASQSFLGGIAGNNTGTIKNTYFTNYVGIDTDGSVSGGITGNNSGNISDNNYYIANGCTDEGAIPKEELQGKLTGASGSYKKGMTYEAGKNSYANYPYPTLKNNNVPEDAGWEDIQAVETGDAQYFYYELYDDNSWGYSSNRFHAVSTLEPTSSNKLVMNDGYGIELAFNRGGYTLVLGDKTFRIAVETKEGVMSWTITESDAAIPQWPAVQEFNSGDDILCRLYIPNDVTERLLAGSTAIAIKIYADVNADIESDAAAAILNTRFNPLFAPGNDIRSPRHIDNLDKVPGGTYTQGLNVDFAQYCKELTADCAPDNDTILTFTDAGNAAVVSGEFTGSYNGNGKRISNLTITMESSENVGLFSVNRGSIARITLLNPKIVGRNNVGAVAGSNLGAVTFCSVQQTVESGESIDSHPTTVMGTSNVGGVVGYNTGKLTDVAVISISGRPAVNGTANVGGIVGTTISNTDSTVDRMMYLAVAPETGTEKLSPFVGSGTVGVGTDKYYLSGSKALRPYQTCVHEILATDYNFLTSNPDEAKNTLDMVNEEVFTGWTQNAPANAADAVSQTNSVFPYPYPNGTTVPDAFTWPIADDITLESADGVVYYEKYSDKTYGVFTRRNNGEEIDYLNNNGVIVECGYAVNVTNFGGTWSANRQNHVAYYDGVKLKWEWKETQKYAFADNTLSILNANQEKQTYSIVPLAALLDFSASMPNTTEPFVLWIPKESNGKRDHIPLAVAYINPLFAKEVYPVTYGTTSDWPITSDPVYPIEHYIRTPWQMQNISKATDYSAGHTFIQDMDLDFSVSSGQTGVSPTITTTTNIVTGLFKGTYNGNSHSISKISLTNGNGLFNNIDSGADVKNLALLKSNFKGSGNIGSIASQNSGTIERIEVSDVTVTASGTGNTGGIVGLNNNSGIVQNVYFNSTYKSSSGIYAAPVTGGANTGGLIGLNNGTLANAYTTAVGPGNCPTIGAGNNAGDQVYFLQATGYNSNAAASPAQGMAKIPEELEKISLGDGWEKATIQTTKDTVVCANSQYPYPKLRGINHYYDWPVITTTLKYYERYSDLSYGYYYPVNETTNVDTLKYDPDLTVIEEGYLIDLATIGTGNSYNIRFNGSTTDNTFTATTTNGRRVIKLPHDKFEELIAAGNISSNGVTPVMIQVSQAAAGTFKNELYGASADQYVYCNPLFAKAIYLKTDAVKDFEIRSSRQMLNIDRTALNGDSRANLRSFHYRQTISLNFAREVIAGRRYYSKVQTYVDADISNASVRTPIAEVGRNVAAGLTGSYNGAYTGSFEGKTHALTGRTGAYRIYNLIMNVETFDWKPKESTGAAFGDLAKGAKVRNLEFVDPQVRFYVERERPDKNVFGMGGGIVSNICYGIIENVNVYNENFTRGLFADANGKTDTQFCAPRWYTTKLEYLACSHAHGGIAAVAYGDGAQIVSCVVGTQSQEIHEVYDNRTTINCRSYWVSVGNELDTDFIHIGGVVGSVSAQARIVSCTNIATVEPLHYYEDRSSCSVGGITGFAGYVSAQSGMNQSVNSKAYLIGCYNAGTIISANSYVGGITGRSAGGASDDNYMTQIISCYNTGRINVRENAPGQLGTVAHQGPTSIRIGGISGETNGTAYYNCYNIGYVSDNVGTRDSDAAGAILGLPWDSKSVVENCYSLHMDKWMPATIVGPKYYSDGKINGIADPTTFAALFGEFRETRATLSDNQELISPKYIAASYPGLTFIVGSVKTYPVFGKDASGFYIYPQFVGPNLGGYPANPHIVPGEDTDADYDAALTSRGGIRSYPHSGIINAEPAAEYQETAGEIEYQEAAENAE